MRSASGLLNGSRACERAIECGVGYSESVATRCSGGELSLARLDFRSSATDVSFMRFVLIPLVLMVLVVFAALLIAVPPDLPDYAFKDAQ